MEVLEVGALDVESKPFTPQGEAKNWEFSPDAQSCARVGVYGETVYWPFLPIFVWVFIFSFV